MRIAFFPLLALLALTIAGCAATGPGSNAASGRVPSVAQGHLGQTVVASSETSDGQAIIDVALVRLAYLDDLNASLRAALANDNQLQARQLLIKIADVVDNPESRGVGELPGLRQLLARAQFHFDQAGGAADADQPVQIAARRADTMSDSVSQNVDTLADYITIGLGLQPSAQTATTLLVLADEIALASDTAHGGKTQNEEIGFYDLQQIVAAGLQQSSQAAATPLKKELIRQFSDNGSGQWAFPVKSPNTAASRWKLDGVGDGGHRRGHDDDDDDDDEDDDDDDGDDDDD